MESENHTQYLAEEVDGTTVVETWGQYDQQVIQ